MLASDDHSDGGAYDLPQNHYDDGDDVINDAIIIQWSI